VTTRNRDADGPQLIVTKKSLSMTMRGIVLSAKKNRNSSLIDDKKENTDSVVDCTPRIVANS